MRYRNENKEKANGVVYTPVDMANYVANQMIKYARPFKNDSISILDPAVGQGSLLVAMINLLNQYSNKIIAVGYETDKEVAERTYIKLKSMYPDVIFDIRIGDFLGAIEEGSVGQYDFVIANPPYIRTQILGSSKAQTISDKLSLTGRIDIYYAFLVYTRDVLKENGIAGFITSNKFMTIKAGSSVRNFMINNFNILHITDLGDTKLFDASVLPCIMIFKHGKTNTATEVSFTSVYQQHNTENAKKVLSIDSVFDVIEKKGTYCLPDNRTFHFQQGTLSSTAENAVWTISSDENLEWISRVEDNTWMTFSQIGKIRVGIKTTADNVFIGDKWTGELSELELLRPLITHRNAGQIIANNNSHWQVLYTHQINNGKKVPYDIERFPKSKAYLLAHFKQLSGREYIRKAKRQWYEIWVPQNPDAWKHKKIVFRDISEKPEFWFDSSGAIVNGDCYWIDVYPDIAEDIVYLALAIANSSFIEKFYDIKFNTKLYSGKRRYQTQYVEQFPIPYYASNEAQEVIALIKKIIAEGSQEAALSYKPRINTLVNQMFS